MPDNKERIESPVESGINTGGLTEVRGGVEVDNKLSEVVGRESAEMTDLQPEKEEALPKNIESWLDRYEKSGSGVSQVNDDGSQQSTGDPIVKIPGSKKSFARNLKKPVSEAGKWLSTFIMKLIKMKEGRVEFEEK